DDAFLVYQTNIVFAAGIIGGPLVLWQLFNCFKRKPRRDTAHRVFWVAFISFCTVVGVLVVGERDDFGVAHLTLLALESLALMLLVDVLSSRRILGGILLAGCLIDFSLGIFLNAHVQTLENVPGQLVYHGV